MADRILTWFIPDGPLPVSLPQFYMDADYEKVALRVRADVAPVTDDLRIDILADDVSIFKNQSATTFGTEGQRTTTPTSTSALVQGDTVEVAVDDFSDDSIPAGSWVRLSVPDRVGASGITIALELDRVNEADGEEP